MRYAFILGREYRLSLAELISLLGYENLCEYDENMAIFDCEAISPDFFHALGGSTRMIEIVNEVSKEQFPTKIISHIEANFSQKISFALASFGVSLPLGEMGMRMKKTLSKKFSVRFLNGKNENVHSAVFKKEKLAKTQTEFAFLSCKNSEKTYFGKTLACQDIDAYSRRDTGKNRDMIVGMMPPKLVQIMLNLAKNSEEFSETFIYDPFCGLGTTLIEALNMGIQNVFGSDISENMIKNSRISLQKFIEEEKKWQKRIREAGGMPKKDFSHINQKCFMLDAVKISHAFAEEGIPRNATIISEGYLGKIMRKEEISQDVIFSERRTIHRLYEQFFSELKKANYCGTIVMSFPFWKVRGVYIFLDEIVTIIEKNGFSVESLLPGEMGLNTKNGSLLYRREVQNVGREIIKIVKK